MYCISDFLQKFLNLERDNKAKISLILEAINQKTKLNITKELIEIRGDNLKIKCSPIVRNEIFMHRSEIEDFLKTQKIFLKMI